MWGYSDEREGGGTAEYPGKVLCRSMKVIFGDLLWASKAINSFLIRYNFDMCLLCFFLLPAILLVFPLQEVESSLGFDV